MYRNENKASLTDFDLMVIRAGGRTQAEIAESAVKWADISRRMHATIAGHRQKVVLWWKGRGTSKGTELHRRHTGRVAH